MRTCFIFNSCSGRNRRSLRLANSLQPFAVTHRPGFPGAASLAARLFLGRFNHGQGVWQLRSSEFIVERPAPGLIHTDGEAHPTAATVHIAARLLSRRLLVPAGRRIAPAPPPSAPPESWKRPASESAR